MIDNPKDYDAHMRKYHRQVKDSRWKRDIHSYTLLKRISFKSEVIDKRIAEIEARYPNVDWSKMKENIS